MEKFGKGRLLSFGDERAWEGETQAIGVPKE